MIGAVVFTVHHCRGCVVSSRDTTCGPQPGSLPEPNSDVHSVKLAVQFEPPIVVLNRDSITSYVLLNRALSGDSMLNRY